MHRNANRARLVGQGSAHGLADPPDGIGAEAIAAPMVKLVNRPHQADVPLLLEVIAAEAHADVALHDVRNQALVGAGEAVANALDLEVEPPHAPSEVRGPRRL